MRTLVSILIVLASGFAASTSLAEPLAVIVSAKFDLKGLSKGELRQAFLGESVNAGGRKLLALNLAPKSGERQAFDQAVLGMGPEEVPRFWVDQRIRGKGKPPKTIPSAATLLRLVAKLPGAIGYVPLSAVTDEVRVLAIDGHTPGEGDYVLR